MAEGGDGGAGGGEEPLHFSKKDSSTAIYVVLLGPAAIAQAHISTVSSQERPVKILTAPL